MYRLYQSETPPDIGYITTTAEKEARTKIEKAVDSVLSNFWKEQLIGDEEQEHLADEISNFYMDSYTNLDEFIYMLRRVPPNLNQRGKIIARLRTDFQELVQFVEPKPKYEWDGFKKIFKGMARRFTNEAYLGEIEDEDLEILAETYLIKKLHEKKKTYIVTLNVRHIGSETAVKMLEKKWELYVRSPDDMLIIVDKRYHHP